MLLSTFGDQSPSRKRLPHSSSLNANDLFTFISLLASRLNASHGLCSGGAVLGLRIQYL